MSIINARPGVLTLCCDSCDDCDEVPEGEEAPLGCLRLDDGVDLCGACAVLAREGGL